MKAVTMIDILITIIFLCIIGGIAYWIITLLPLPEPFKQIAMVCLLLIFLLVVVSMFLGGGAGFIHLPLR